MARLGNPREVVLKVAEALRFLEMDGLEEPSEAEDEDEAPADDSAASKATDSSADQATGDPNKLPPNPDVPLPLVVNQYQVLLSMLAILHPRIKTKYPSRFLSTSLQAVLAAYSKATMFHEELTTSTVQLIIALAELKRPHLPPRRSSSSILLASTARTAPDPEAHSDPPSNEELAMQRRLFQSLLTHVFEDYMLSLHSSEDVPGLAWSSRLEEKLHPERIVPGKITNHEQFEKSDKLQLLLGTVGQLVALAQDLEIDSDELFKIITDLEPEEAGHPAEEDEPPSAPKDIPLSKTGSLFLFTARKAAEELYSRPKSTKDVAIFPHHAVLLKNFVGGVSRATIGLEPESLIDTILFLGLTAIERNDIGVPASDDEFAEYLQNTSLLSANTPSASLRYGAHVVTSTVLHSHPHDLARLTFIRDTLEHCPYANLKASAVSWLKTETLLANGAPAAFDAPTTPPSIFATPVALSALTPSLFPDLSAAFAADNNAAALLRLRDNASFFLAALNFYYLVLRARHLWGPLDVRALAARSAVEAGFVEPLRALCGRVRAAGFEDEHDAVEVALLEGVVADVEVAREALGE